MLNPSEVGKSGEMVRLRTLESIWDRASSACGAAGHTSVVVQAETCSTSCWHPGNH